MWHCGSMSFLFADALVWALLGCCGRVMWVPAWPRSGGQPRHRGFASPWLFSPLRQALTLLE